MDSTDCTLKAKKSNVHIAKVTCRTTVNINTTRGSVMTLQSCQLTTFREEGRHGCVCTCTRVRVKGTIWAGWDCITPPGILGLSPVALPLTWLSETRNIEAFWQKTGGHLCKQDSQTNTSCSWNSAGLKSDRSELDGRQVTGPDLGGPCSWRGGVGAGEAPVLVTGGMGVGSPAPRGPVPHGKPWQLSPSRAESPGGIGRQVGRVAEARGSAPWWQ